MVKSVNFYDLLALTTIPLCIGQLLAASGSTSYWEPSNSTKFKANIGTHLLMQDDG
jgi:hypothetical protein